MIIFQTVILQIRTQIVDLPTARAMWEYLEHRHYSSSQAELYTLYHSLSGLQQGEDIMDQFYNSTVHYGIILMLSNLHTTLYMLLRFLPALSHAPIIIVMMRHVICMSSSCVSTPSLSLLRPSYFMLHPHTLWMRHSPLFMLRRPTSRLPSQGGVVLLLPLDFFLYLRHPPLLILHLLPLPLLGLLHGRDGM